MLSKEKPPKKVTMWLQDDNRRSIVSIRLNGMNMQGTGTTGFIFKKETFITKFTIECMICSYRWTVTRSFDEFSELYATMHNNPTISARRKLLVSYIISISIYIYEYLCIYM